MLPLLALLLGLGAVPAHALTTISTSTTIDASNSINDAVLVTGADTVVTIVSGGWIGDTVQAENNSTVNVSGGSISGFLFVTNSTVNVSGGSISGFLVAGNSTVNVTGGSISGELQADSSTVNLSGGWIGSDLEATSGSTVNVTGGAISGDLNGSNSSVSFFGCSLVLADRNVTGTLQDGTAINLRAFATGDSILLHNAPPVITCPPSVTVPNEPGLCGAHVTATATASASCPGVTLPVSGVRSDGLLLADLYPLGTTSITWTTTDAVGNQATCTQSITVKDTAGPTISGLAATPNRLWPPNHQLVGITVSYTGSDNCAGALTWALSATSSEADSGLGTDDVPGDIQIVDAHHLKLRAERYGKQGRVYTLTVTGTDAAGNRTQKTLTVGVPH